MISKKQTQLTDRFNRQVNYLRISVTDRCNLRCRYCAPSMPKPVERHNQLRFSEMRRLARISKGIGITKVRLTGGEPLCRKGVVAFIEELSRVQGLQDISLTTNGTLLAKKARRLKDAGLNRINISLDTLDRRKYHQLTGADLLNTVWNGIEAAASIGFDPIKINVVVMKGFNDTEIEKMARLTLTYPFHIRFIEYMPIGTDPVQSGSYFLPAAKIRKRIEQTAPLMPVSRTAMDGPAERYRFVDAPGEIGLITAMSAHFCGTCNRLRLTANGQLRPCLLSDETVDILTPLRENACDESLAALFWQAIRKKQNRHHMNFTRDRMLQTKMVSIGG